jgi:hypothetical protein
MVAADRIGAELMGVNPAHLGYLQWCGETGVGTWDRARIDLRGDSVEKHQVQYRQPGDIDRQLQWMGPLTELPPKLG